jgi:hypothetical protein
MSIHKEEIYKDFIEKIKNNNITNKILLKKKLSENNKTIEHDYFKTNALSLQFKDDSIFTPRFLYLIEENLGTIEKFENLSKKEKEKIYNKLLECTEVEGLWKILNKKICYESNYITKLFPNDLEIFNEICVNSFLQTDLKNNVNKKLPKQKLTILIKELIAFLIEKKPVFIEKIEKNNLILNDITISKIINNIDYTYFFCSLVKICMKKAMENMLNPEDNNINLKIKSKNNILKEPFLFIKRTDILYLFQKVFIKYIYVLWLNSLNDIGILKIKSEDHLISINMNIDNIIRQFYNDISSLNWFEYSFDLSFLLIDHFSETNIVLSKELISHEKEKKIVIFGLNNKIQNSIPLSQHIPMIISPVDFKTNTEIMDIVSPIPFGISDLKFSKLGMDSLNISHKKKFKINPIYYNILYYLHCHESLKYNNIFSFKKQKPLVSNYEYNKQLEYFINITDNGFNSLKSFTRYHINTLLKIKITDIDKKISLYNFNKICNSYCNIHQIESDDYNLMLKTFKNLQILRNKRLLLLSSLIICELLNSFPIYYSHKLDYRTRMYPWQYLISRTSGSLKHLLMDYKPMKLTKNGIIELFRAYFMIDVALSKKFEAFLLTLNLNLNTTNFIKLLKDFYNDNYIKLYNIKKEIYYFLLLQVEIERILKENKLIYSNINLEIDQNASGVVFLALFLKNKNLAEQCNLLNNGLEKKNVYDYVNNHIKEFLINKSFKEGHVMENYIIKDDNSHRVFDFFSKTKKATKYAVMCFCFNQTGFGRMEYWKSLWFDIYNDIMTQEEYYILSKLAFDYKKFLEIIFPKLTEQLKIINKTLKLITKKGFKVKIRTLDGAVISWDFFDTIDKIRSVYNPSTNEHVSYRLKQVCKNSKGDLESNKSMHRKSFLPNIIHSIDAAIMRIIVKKIYDENHYIINQLHDCGLMHPNIAPLFFEKINDIYTSDQMLNMADALFFDVIKSDLDEDTLKQVNKLQKKFHKLCDDFKITKNNFNSRFMYSYES